MPLDRAAQSVPRLDLRHSWREPPAVSVPAVAQWTNLLFWVVGGLTFVVGSILLGWAPAHRDGVVAIGVGAVAVGLVILARGRRFPRAVYFGLTGLGTVLITTAVLLGGGGSASLALSAPYLFVMINAVFIFSLRASLVVAVAAETAAAVTLGITGVAAGEIIIMAGCRLGTTAVVAWLARVANAAEEDPLTGLLNRRGLERRMREAVAAAARHGGEVSVALLDLDGFARVNHDLGREAGDRLLVRCASTWWAGLPEGTFLSRYSGDEFALLAPGMSLGATADLADHLRSLVPDSLTAAAGVAAWQPGDSASIVISRADVALYDAKAAGCDHTVVHGDPEHGSRQLEAAIAAGQMRLYLQPLVHLASGQTVGHEALVRWHHPTRGIVFPGDFIPLAERTGAVRALGRWTLREACRAVMAAPEPRPYIGVNASVRELQEPDYADSVCRELTAWSMPADLLVVEVTESALGAEEPAVRENLRRLREHGVHIALDDFGSGYSSLRRLEALAPDVLKIDGSLVSSIGDETQEAPILTAIVAMAHALGAQVVAEWVETPHQAQLLTRLGVDIGQGFLFGRAEPAAVAG